MSAEAVSYTHLDVYKRQGVKGPEEKALAQSGRRPASDSAVLTLVGSKITGLLPRQPPDGLAGPAQRGHGRIVVQIGHDLAVIVAVAGQLMAPAVDQLQLIREALRPAAHNEKCGPHGLSLIHI